MRCIRLRLIGLVMVTLTAGLASATDLVPAAPAPIVRATPLLETADDGTIFGPPLDRADPFVEFEASVTPNVRGLAYAPETVAIPLPDGSVLSLRTRSIEHRAGVDVDDDGNLIVDPDPKAISLFWWGSDGDNVGTITVHYGHMRAYIVGSAGRFHVLRDRDGLDRFQVMSNERVNQVGCLTGQPGTSVDLIDKTSGAGIPWSSTRYMPQNAHAHAAPLAPSYYVAINVVFMYTPNALASVSSSGDPTAFIPIADAALDELNVALQNTHSARHLRVRRAGPMIPINYGETPGQPIDRDRWLAHRNFLIEQRFNDAGSNDGIDILGSRLLHGGDIVVMFVGDPGSAAFPFGPWGIAVAQRQRCVNQFPALTCSPGAGYKDYAFVVQNALRATTDFTMAHEIGHALGSEHDRAGSAGNDFVDWTTIPTPDQVASFAHSFGYRVGVGGTAGAKGDVMSSPLCLPFDNQSNCWARLPQFADPARLFDGLAVPAGQLPPGNPNTGYGHNSATFGKLAEDVASFYGGAAERPLFWDGFES